MRNSVKFVAASMLAACLGAAVPADAADRNQEKAGVCSIRAADLIGTFGFSAAGTNLQENQLIAAGPFAQVGTATGTSATRNGDIITGRWVAEYTQNDSSGLKPFKFNGSYTVNTKTCTGDFSYDGVGPVFRAILVNGAREFRSMSVLPGVIISFNSGQKL